MIKKLMSYIGEFKRDTILSPVFVTVEVFLEVLLPTLMALVIDNGVETGDMNYVMKMGLIMLVVAMLSLAAGTLSGVFAAKASMGFGRNLRRGMFDNIQDFAFRNIDHFSTAGLVTRMTTDVTNVQNAYQMILRIAVRAPFTLICSMIMCFVINAKLSLIFVIAIIVLGAFIVVVVKTTMKIFDMVFKKYDALNASVQENVSAIRVVKAFVREDYENKKFITAAENVYKLFVKAEGILAFNGPVMMLVVYFCIICLSWFGAKFIVVGNMTTGELTSMFSYIMSILMSLMMLSMIFVMTTLSIASGKRIAEVLNDKADLVNPKNPIMEVKNGSIDFNHVEFTYNDEAEKDTLIDIDLHIHSGETVGIIGGTGCGKSSLVNLISRLYDVNEGSVLVGGKDVKEYDLEVLRNQVAVVLQKNVLFSGTILENLRWGNETATKEECIEACKNACADEFIERFPNKYETYIEQGGSNVSGGQKQRLCIARALLKKPQILILDDSTSAVDTATDAKIRSVFAKKIPDTTKIIIAQRISSVQDADRILVLDDGKINGFDTHENLLKTNEIYQEIYNTQVKGGGDFDQTGGAK